MRFGRYLALERELRGVKLSDVAERTKIPMATLEAIEADAKTRLPGRVYVLGYLGAYADAVGLDVDEVVLRYQEAYGAGDREEEAEPPPGTTTPAAPPSVAPRQVRITMLSVLVALVLAGLVLFFTIRG